MMFLDSDVPPQDYLKDPYAHFARWRAASPLHYVARRDLWLVTSYDLVVQMLRDEHLVPGHGTSFAERSRHFRITVVKELRAFFAALDDIGIDAIIRDVAQRAFTRVLERGEADLVTDIAQAVPGAVMGRLLGVPEADLIHLHPLSVALINDYDLCSTSAAPARGKALTDAYFRRHLARARRREIAPLLTLLVRAQQEHGFADEVLADVCSRLLSAGSSTTAGCLGNILVRLLRMPDDGAIPLRPDARQTDALVEELIRLDTPVLGARRRAGRSFNLAGEKIAEGQLVLPMLAAANRDPAYFANPDAVDLTRTGKKHLSFGQGAFHCLGAPLTRKEIHAVLACVLPCRSAFKLHAPPVRKAGWLLHEPARLPATIEVSRHVA